MQEDLAYRFMAEGRAATRIREIDWGASALGPIDAWSESLRSLLGIMSRSHQPMMLLMGSELLQFYNDAYIDEGLSRHPAQMGASLASTWPELTDTLENEFANVLAHGVPTLHDDSLIRIVRHRQLVDTYWSYGCTPFLETDGLVKGVLVIPTETTQRVLAEKRQAALHAFSQALSAAGTATELPEVATSAIRSATQDGTLLSFYRSPRSGFALEAGRDSGAAAEPLASQLTLARLFEENPPTWSRLLAGEAVHEDNRFLVPLAEKGAAGVLRFIDYSLDPRLPFDEPYRQYLHQITERLTQASDRLEAAASRASSASERQELLMHAPIATAVLTGPDLVFTLANARFRNFASHHRELDGKTFEAAFPELAGTELSALLHSIFEKGEPYDSPETLVYLNRGPGREREACYIRFTIQPVKTFEGDVHALVAVAIDLTDQVRNRQAIELAHVERQAKLEANTERLEEMIRARTETLHELNRAMSRSNDALQQAVEFTRNVTEMVPGRIAFWDADLRCRFANENFCRWVGRKPGEVVGELGEDLFPPGTVDRVRPHVDGVLAGVAQRFETQWIQPDGTVFHNQVDYVPERAKPGQRAGFYLMATDITQLKEAKLALQALNADLALSRDQAEAANRAKSAFLANMSHEIRTPLNAILGMTHILSRRTVDAEQQRQLGKVNTAAKHLLGLVSDVLDLSKIEAGKLVLERTDFVTADVIDWAMESVRGFASDKGLEMLHETGTLPRTLRGDSLRLSQILINLLSNAVKFTSAGSVVLGARVIEQDGDRTHLHFEVADTGIGIDDLHKASLFGAFEQADTSISRRHGGTGLGLALSRQLARAMGGDAGVESELGVGSRFWFRVWLDRSSSDAPLRDASHGASKEGWNAQLAVRVEDLEAEVRRLHEGQHVLLAEDNLINREVGVALLEGAGLVAVTADDGEKAVALVRQGGIDLILMDMQMPHVDGLEATKTIRADMFSLPIVAMTANAFIDDRHACMEAGMDDHLAKPVEPSILYSKLLRWLPPRDR